MNGQGFDRSDRGFALLGVLMLAALLAALLAGYFTLTRIDMGTVDASMDSVRGFYAAEAGSNIRAELVRQTFEGYNRPMGSAPDTSEGAVACAGDNTGSGDFACDFYGFQDRDVKTFVQEPPGNPTSIVIPRGEQFQNLHAQEYRYLVRSESTSPADRTEAAIELLFKSRLVPMFQFAAFYNKDLEILPGPTMTLAGPVHANGDLYLGSHNSLSILGQVTTAGSLYHGRKNEDTCMDGGVAVIDPEDLSSIPACGAGRILLEPDDVVPWNNMIQMGIEELTVPPPEALDPTPGQIYWDKAEIRIMLDLHGATPEIEVRNPDGTTNAGHTLALGTCGAASHSNTFFNNREGGKIEMLDVNARALLDCLHQGDLLPVGQDIDETSEGGLVWYLGVDGPASNTVNHYGVRVRNGGELKSTVADAPAIRGLTVVTNQAVYVQGDYNKVNKKPASFLADSMNVLSNAWNDANSELALGSRVASDTTLHAAILAGTDTTGGPGGEGEGGQDNPASGGLYNGGLENYPRFHEKWNGKKLTYLGSFVSLNQPQHVDGTWVYGAPQYEAPIRDWGYDTDFNQAENLPPLAPRFVYLRQELFVRDFDL
jgi:hypothetical protein